MTQEEKAKAYDEAIKRAEKWADKYIGGWRNNKFNLSFDITGEIAKDFLNIFPKLKESDDERIRKWIIEELEITRDAMSGKHPYSDDPDIVARLKRLDEAIAYLEKHKEMNIQIDDAILNSRI